MTPFSESSEASHHIAPRLVYSDFDSGGMSVDCGYFSEDIVQTYDPSFHIFHATIVSAVPSFSYFFFLLCSFCDCRCFHFIT